MTKAQVQLTHIIMAKRGTMADMVRRTGWNVTTLRCIQGGKSPTMAQAGVLRQLLGIPLEDWLTPTEGT